MIPVSWIGSGENELLHETEDESQDRVEQGVEAKKRRTYQAPTVHDLAADVLRDHGTLQLIVRGSSMEPLCPEGARVNIVTIDHAEVCVGDILVFKHKDYLLTHRCIGVFDSFILAKGDNCRHPDTLVPREALVGRAENISTDRWEIRLREPRWRRCGRVLAYCGRLDQNVRGSWPSETQVQDHTGSRSHRDLNLFQRGISKAIHNASRGLMRVSSKFRARI